MRKVIVFQDKNYGASKASATEHTALLALDLAEGAVGVYGIPKTSTNNKEKMALITDGGSDAAGLVPDAAFDGLGVHIAVGTALGAQTSGEIDVDGVTKVTAQAYTAPVAQVIDVAVAIWATVAKRDAATLRVIDSENFDQGGPIRSEMKNFSYSTNAGDDEYAIAAGIVAAADADPQEWVTAAVTVAEAGSAVSGNATVVNGSKQVLSTAHGLTAGDYVKIDGNTYLAAAVPGVNEITLDRPYGGASGTVLAASVLDLGATVTVVGIKLTSLVQGKNFEVSCMEVIEDSTIVYTTAGTDGHGTGTLVRKMENEVRGYLGSTAGATDAIMQFPELKALAAGTYDIYVLTVKNPSQISTGGTAIHAHNLYKEIVCVFPDGPSNNGQADFEAVLGQVLFGAANIGGIA